LFHFLSTFAGYHVYIDAGEQEVVGNELETLSQQIYHVFLAPTTAYFADKQPNLNIDRLVLYKAMRRAGVKELVLLSFGGRLSLEAVQESHVVDHLSDTARHFMDLSFNEKLGGATVVTGYLPSPDWTRWQNQEKETAEVFPIGGVTGLGSGGVSVVVWLLVLSRNCLTVSFVCCLHLVCVMCCCMLFYQVRVQVSTKKKIHHPYSKEGELAPGQHMQMLCLEVYFGFKKQSDALWGEGGKGVNRGDVTTMRTVFARLKKVPGLLCSWMDHLTAIGEGKINNADHLLYNRYESCVELSKHGFELLLKNRSLVGVPSSSKEAEKWLCYGNILGTDDEM
jgi:hypothetical protein